MIQSREISFDPRTKVIAFVVMISMAFICTDLYVLAALLTVTLLIAVISKSRRKIFGGFKVMGPVLVVAFLLWSVFHEWSLFYRYGETGVRFDIGLFMTVRLLLIIAVSLTFINIITPAELMNALNALRLPYKLVFVLGLTLRHISTISDEYRAIKEAQTSRGLELDKGSLVKRIRNYIPVIIPLLVRGIESAEKLLLAMELKSFSFERKRYVRCKMKLRDFVIVYALLVALIISVLHYTLKVF